CDSAYFPALAFRAKYISHPERTPQTLAIDIFITLRSILALPIRCFRAVGRFVQPQKSVLKA
ncbi:MAG: hypothetical protein WCA91_11790, partial [Candidatus Acidiferrales bacterium]